MNLILNFHLMATKAKKIVETIVEKAQEVVKEVNGPKKLTASELSAMEIPTKRQIVIEICDKKGMQYPDFRDQRAVSEAFLDSFILKNE